MLVNKKLLPFFLFIFIINFHFQSKAYSKSHTFFLTTANEKPLSYQEIEISNFQGEFKGLDLRSVCLAVVYKICVATSKPKNLPPGDVLSSLALDPKKLFSAIKLVFDRKSYEPDEFLGNFYKDVSLKRTDGGLTNANFFATATDIDGKKLEIFAKGLNNNVEDLQISRKDELAIHIASARKGLAPPIIIYSQTKQIVALEKMDVNTVTPELMNDSVVWGNFIKLVKDFHSTDIDPCHLTNRDLDHPIKVIQQFWKDLNAINDRVAEKTAELYYYSLSFRGELNDLKMGVIHGDLNEGNIFVVKDTNETFLADFEYSKKGPVLYDLAYFSEELKFTDETERKLLEDYFENGNKKFIDKKVSQLKKLKFLGIVFQLLWSEMMIVKTPGDSTYTEFRDEITERAFNAYSKVDND